MIGTNVWLELFDDSQRAIVRIIDRNLIGISVGTFSTSFRRALFHAAPTNPGSHQQWMLVDVLPPDAAFPHGNEATIQSTLVGTDWKVDFVRLVGEVRCHLGPLARDAIVIDVQLTATNNGFVFQSLTLNGLAINVSSETLLFDPITIFGIIPGQTPPLLDAIGLQIAQQNAVSARFVHAFLPAPAQLTDHDPDNNLYSEKKTSEEKLKKTAVLRLQQDVSLAAADQHVVAGSFRLDLPGGFVTRAGLSQADPNNLATWPLKLVQTHNGFNALGELSEDLNAWVVRFKGLPSAAVLPAYNRLAREYHRSLRTIEDGRPVSGLPLIDDGRAKHVWDPIGPGASQNAKACERELFRPWLLTLNAIDKVSAGSVGTDLVTELRKRVTLRAGFPIGPNYDPQATKPFLRYQLTFPGMARHDFGTARGGVATLDCRILRPTPLFENPQANAAMFEDRIDSIWRGLWFQFERLFTEQSPRVTSSTAIALATAATTLVVSDASVFPAVPFSIQIDDEVILVIAANLAIDELTIVRAQNGTVAAAHAIGATIRTVDDFPQRLRMGALDLELSSPLPPLTLFDAPDLSLEIANLPPESIGKFDESINLIRRRSLIVLGVRDSRGFAADMPTEVIDARLRVDAAEPGGQDGLPDEPFIDGESAGSSPAPDDKTLSAVQARFVREASVIVPLAPPQRRNQMILQIRERTPRSESRHLAMQLYNWGPSAPGERQPLLILDRRPFLVAKVWAPPLTGLAGPDGNLEVGNWSANGFDGASWELAGATDGYVVNFPPQAVGEGTEKRRGSDIQDGVVVPSRLSPATRLEILASYFRQNFVEATWNLRRILGYPGQRAPGAGLRRMEFELLYGLGCSVRADGLRLSELQALLGTVPGRLPQFQNRPLGTSFDSHDLQNKAFEQLNYRWSRQYAAQASRLGVYLPWMESQPNGLLLRSGVNYLLRDPDQIMADPTLAATPSDKLPGGALWGLEFESAYRVFKQQPEKRRSTAGELARPALSALGGWGYQKAIFDSGLTTIYSDTAMGRTFFYSMERRGRIAGFYNHAKHVVIYERTVGTSQQFRDEQDLHAGRPVIRKVREFVELIQPIRQYPDLGDSEVTRGFVLGIDFKTKVIPVTSTWGRDVSGPGGALVGYVIPLWQIGADPAVYPKPQVVLKIAGAGGKGEQMACSLDEPQKLLFFSAAESGPAATPEGELNTDKWAAVAGVDFPDLPWPSTPNCQPDPGADNEAPLPDEQTTSGGYDAWTYAITAPGAADIVASRTGQSLGALIRNVSMIRANPLQADNSPKAVSSTSSTVPGEHALEMRRRMAQSQSLISELKAAIGSPLTDPRTRQSIDRSIAALNTELGGLANNFEKAFELPTGTTTLPTVNWDSRLSEGISRWVDQAKTARKKTLDKLKDDLLRIPEGPLTPQIQADAMHRVDDALDLYRLALPVADGGLSDIFKRGRAALELPRTLAASFEESAEQFATTVNGAIGDLLDDVVLSAEEQARLAKIGDAFAAATILSLRRLIDPAVAALVKNLPESVGTRIRDALTWAIDGNPAEPNQPSIQDFARRWRSALALPVEDLLDVVASLDQLATRLADLFRTAVEEMTGPITVKKALDGLQPHLASLYAIPIAGGKNLGDLISEDGLNRLRKELQDKVSLAASLSQIRSDVAAITSELATLYDQIVDPITGQVTAAITGQLTGLANTLTADATNLLGTINPANVAAKLTQLTGISTATQNLETLKRNLESRVGALESELQRIGENIAAKVIEKFPSGLVQTAGTALRLVRAFGDAPDVTGMAFNRQRLGYFYLPEKALAGMPVDMTAATALVNRAGEHLKGLGISLPAGQLLDQVVPPDLSNFDFGKLLPDFAGLRLDNLLPNLKAPEGLGDKVKVTNKFDPATGRGWSQADVAIDSPEPTTLFDAGPIAVNLRDVSFRATIRIEAGLSGAPKHTQYGNLSSNWDLTFGGEPLITFNDTQLTFDEAGHTRFTLDPTKVEMNGLLSMLSDVLKTVSDPEGGFTLRLKERGGFPVGVEAVLNLPLPDLTFGVCALTNLRFGAELDLEAVPEFAIGLRVHVGEKMAPVCVAILVLAGGCWFDARARYFPLTRRTTAAVSIGLNAGAMLAIALGPIRGCVFAFIFIEGEFRTDSESPGSQQLIVRIGLILGGDVDLLGLVTVCIRLLLELEYNGQSGDLVGRGTLSLRVKICWCFTIKVNKTVEKKFAGNSRETPRRDPARVDRACDQHLSRTA